MTTKNTPPKNRLKLSRLDFLSLVDQPAQETATIRMIKSADGAADEVVGIARIVKTDAELGLIWAYAMTPAADGRAYYDLHGDTIDADSMVKAAAEFMLESRASDVNHDYQADGTVVFCWPLTEETAKAFDIESATTGLMVAIKPSPEVFERCKRGELTGVSLAGTGIREPAEKSAAAAPPAPEPRTVEEAIAVIERDGHHLNLMIGKWLRDKTDVERIEFAKQQHATWWSPIVLKAAAIEEKSEEAQIRKREEAVTVELEKIAGARVAAKKRLDELAEAVAKRKNITAAKAMTELLDSGSRYTLPEAEEAADCWDRMQRGRSAERAAKARRDAVDAERELERARGELDEMVERFALQHNLDRAKAHTRLLEISTRAKTLSESISTSREALRQARTMTEHAKPLLMEVASRKKAEEEHAATLKAAEAATTPAERALKAQIQAIATKRAVTYQEATVIALDSDPVARSLYEAVQAERMARRQARG